MFVRLRPSIFSVVDIVLECRSPPPPCVLPVRAWKYGYLRHEKRYDVNFK